MSAVLAAGTAVMDGFSSTDAAGLPAYLVEYARSSFESARPDTQVLTLNTTGVRGTFRVTLYGESTVPLAFDATAAEMQDAIGALSVVRAPEVELKSAGSSDGLRQWRIAFVGDRGSGEIAAVEFDGSDLVA